jgi:penicillin-binding protein 1A
MWPFPNKPVMMSRKKRLLIYSAALALTGLLLGSLTIVGTYLYFAPTLPATSELRDIRYQVPLRVYSQDGKLIAEYGEQRRIPLTLEDIPDQLEHAILAAEDDRFYTHPGIDLIGIARAMWQNITAGRIVGGASTITQQVARNFFLTFDQTWTRKIREIFLAIKIEQELSKDEILTLYLNKIYLGNRAYGVGAAADIYYGKAIDELDLAQMAMIATLPKAPSRYNPLANPERALQRRAYVLGRMIELGYIGQTDYEVAMAAPVTAEFHGVEVAVDAPYLGEMVRAEMLTRFGDATYTDGYEVITTIDSRQQLAANRAIQDALQEYDSRYGYRGPLRRIEPEVLDEIPPASGMTSDVDAPGRAEVLDQLLADVPTPARLLPAVVLEVDDTAATIHIRKYGEAQLGMDALSWARPVDLATGQLGRTPELPSEVLAPGDVIQVLQLPFEEADIEERESIDIPVRWRLAQLPEVQGALVSVTPDTGAIRALVGGYDYYLSKFNRAVQAQRQPGSSFKPFIYSAALANDFTPASIVNDAPVVFADDQLQDVWRPENDSGRFYGPTRLREALVRSRNLVSIRVLQSIGIATAIDYISTTFDLDRQRLPRDLSLALGSASFSPLEMSSAYAVLANGGYEFEPYFIESIKGPSGKPVYLANPLIVCDEECQAEREAANDDNESENAIDAMVHTLIDVTVSGLEAGELVEPLPLTLDDELAMIEQPTRYAERVQLPQVNYLITDMMRDVIQRGTGVRARELARNDLAGKTGTTNEYRDAWFSGFNRDVATTVWVGFDDFSTLGSGEYGGRAALPAWISFMRVALAGTDSAPHERPDGLVSVRIDPESGLLAASGNPDAIFETFIEGTLPERESEDAIINPDTGRKEDDTSEQDLF